MLANPLKPVNYSHSHAHAEHPLPSHCVCFYCKLAHPGVEAGGVHHCPNRLCSGPGAAYYRRSFKSYKDNSDGTYTFDVNELLQAVSDNPQPSYEVELYAKEQESRDFWLKWADSSRAKKDESRGYFDI